MSSFPLPLRLPRMATYYGVRRTCPPGTRISSVRRSQYHRTSSLRYPYKDDQSKDSLSPRSTEYSKSAGDDSAAAQEQAFDPSKTSPEEEREAADVESGDVSHKPQKSDNNPLEVSPANQEMSRPRDPREGGPTNASRENRDRTSKTGGAKKAGRMK